MNCHPTLCGMLAEVADGRLVSVRGDKANPDSQGFLCVRGQASREVIDNPERLLYPLMRDGRSEPLRQCTWEEALTRIASHMRDPESVGIWPGHGVLTTNYGTRISAQLLARFANFHGSSFWNPTMICWGLGAFGLGLTGMLETHTKEDLGEHSELVILWAANLASQPNTARHLLKAKARGAYIVTIEVRGTETAHKSDEVLLVRPGTDAALALALMHVICAEDLYDRQTTTHHAVGFGALKEHVKAFPPKWASQVTGVSAEQIVGLARRYARCRPGMIVLGGSSMHKGDNGWEAARAIACLPALSGNLGIPGGGLGPRHGSSAHGRGLGSIVASERRTRPMPVPSQMSEVTQALRDRRVKTLLLMGTNMLSSFADAGALEEGLATTELVVSYDLFLNDTARRFADIVLPGTAWLEEVGCKMTHTHLYLMEKALEVPGEARSVHQIVTELARRLGLDGFDAWPSEEAMIDAILDHPCTGRATVAALRAEDGIRALHISHVANPDLRFDTPSKKVEFYSELALGLGLAALPGYTAPTRPSAGAMAAYPLALTQGRTLSHFHGFYNNGRVLPTLAKREKEPSLWIGIADAHSRGLEDGEPIRIFNARGSLVGRAHVTDRIPSGTVWMRDGWPGLNRLTENTAVLPVHAVDVFGFSAGQASFRTFVDVEPA
jgi:anaerobic selenocysteine-containing dehydrogenase